MLPRKNRISRKDFPSHNVKGFPNQQIRGSAVKFFSPYFSAVFYRGNDKNTAEGRASVVVSKKTAKTAVDRNRLRRRFYDIVAPYFNDGTVSTTVVFYPKLEAKNADHSVLRSEIEKVFKQAKLIK